MYNNYFYKNSEAINPILIWKVSQLEGWRDSAGLKMFSLCLADIGLITGTTYGLPSITRINPDYRVMSKFWTQPDGPKIKNLKKKI